jgi:YHS domain-containing protein
MGRILLKALVFTFVVGLSSTCLSNALWACGGTCGGGEHSGHESGGQAVQTKDEAVKDPVCGMEVSDIKKAPSEKYKDKVYYFCSEHCKKTFKKDPVSHIPTKSPQHGEGEGHKH